MKRLFTGLSGFLICLLVGILLDQVALGILAGVFLGAFLGVFLGTRKADGPPGDNPNA